MNKVVCLAVAAGLVGAACFAEAAVPKRLHTLRFTSSTSTLSKAERAKLVQVARRIDTGELAAIRLIGHTDRHGSPVANLALGLRRARDGGRPAYRSRRAAGSNSRRVGRRIRTARPRPNTGRRCAQSSRRDLVGHAGAAGHGPIGVDFLVVERRSAEVSR